MEGNQTYRIALLCSNLQLQLENTENPQVNYSLGGNFDWPGNNAEKIKENSCFTISFSCRTACKNHSWKYRISLLI
jgi:hypothetical protein